MESLLKSLLCLKKDFPYGDNDGLTFYDPGCIESMYECQDLCGKKCINKCKMAHNPDCSRGKLAQNFLFCPMRLEKDKIKTLESIHYGLVIDSHTKEGKKPYKRMEKIKEEKNVNDFLKDFTSNFLKYGKHKVENWFISTLKTASTSPKSQCQNTLFSVSDFAQNLKLSSKKETSEEYFHQKQISMFGTVSTVNVPCPGGSSQQHSLSQITTSDNK